jgi:tetratricopeptide (TPR) repeat protein
MKKVICFFSLLLSLTAMTACSKTNENTAKGMQAAEDLDYQSAITFFEAAVAQGEPERPIARGMGIAYMGMANYTKAIQYFEAALSASDGLIVPMDYDLNYYLAAAYTKDNLASQAETVYDAILALKPKEKDAYFLRGNVRLEQENQELAMEDFEKTVSLEPENYSRLIQIYEVLTTHGLEEKGMVFLQRAMEKGENKMTAYDKGRIYYYMENYDQAAAQLEEARGKGGADVFLYLGKSYEAMGENNYAASVYQDYINKDDQSAPIYNQLGLCEMSLGDYEAALSAFEAGLALNDPGMTQSLSWNQIAVYEFLGEFQKANVLIGNYMQKFPDDEKAKREADFLSTR